MLCRQPRTTAALLALARASLLLGNTSDTDKALAVAKSAGGNPAAIAELQARLYVQLGGYQALLSAIDGGDLPLAEPLRSLHRAQALVGLRRPGEALVVTNTLLHSQPRMAAVRVVRADCFVQLNNGRQALLELNSAVALEPESADAWLARGRFLQLSGDLKAAEQSWGKAVQYAPGRLDTLQQITLYSTLEDLQIGRNDLAAARATQLRLIVIAPQAAVTKLFAARLKLLGGDTRGAAAELHQLVNSNPNLDEAHVVLISALLAQQNLAQARVEIDLLLSRAPQADRLKAVDAIVAALAKGASDADRTDSYWMNMAAAQVALAQPAMVKAALDRAQSLSADPTRALAAMAVLELRTGNFEAAARLSTGLVARHPDDAIVALIAGRACEGLGQYQLADAIIGKVLVSHPTAEIATLQYQLRSAGKLPNRLEPLQTWLKANPADLPVRSLYADALAADGQDREAIAEYERLRAGATTNAAVLTKLSWLYFAQHDARALSTARAAWRSAGSVPEVADAYGWMLLQAGSVAESLKVLQPACAADCATRPQLRFHTAAALERSHHKDEARQLLTASLAEVPEFTERAAAEKLLANLG
jgi:tetratricopeptide (TPR) repeat protein